MGVIRIAAAVMTRGDGRCLLVRKRGTAAFMQAGGKIEAGESAEAALRRELAEELGVTVGVVDYLGRFVAPAAHEAGWVVEAELFGVVWDGDVVAGGEIAEVAWVDPLAPGEMALAPLTRDVVLPMVRFRSATT